MSKLPAATGGSVSGRFRNFLIHGNLTDPRKAGLCESAGIVSFCTYDPATWQLAAAHLTILDDRTGELVGTIKNN